MNPLYKEFKNLYENEQKSLEKRTDTENSRKVKAVAVGVFGTLASVAVGLVTKNPFFCLAGIAATVQTADSIATPEKYLYSTARNHLAYKLNMNYVENETFFEKLGKPFGIGRAGKIVTERRRDFDAIFAGKPGNYWFLNQPQMREDLEDVIDGYHCNSDLEKLINEKLGGSLNSPKNTEYEEKKKESAQEQEKSEASTAYIPEQVNSTRASQQKDNQPSPSDSPTPSTSPKNPSLIGRLIDLIKSVFSSSGRH